MYTKTNLIHTYDGQNVSILFLVCPSGLHGKHCSAPCPKGYYGELCAHRCECPDEFCNPTTGCVLRKGACVLI